MKKKEITFFYSKKKNVKKNAETNKQRRELFLNSLLKNKKGCFFFTKKGFKTKRDTKGDAFFLLSLSLKKKQGLFCLSFFYSLGIPFLTRFFFFKLTRDTSFFSILFFSVQILVVIKLGSSTEKGNEKTLLEFVSLFPFFNC